MAGYEATLSESLRAGLDVYLKAMREFVKKRLIAAYGDRWWQDGVNGVLPDYMKINKLHEVEPKHLAEIVKRNFDEAFESVFRRDFRGTVARLNLAVEARNKWAHEGPLSVDDVDNYLFNMAQLLSRAGPTQAKEDINRIRRDLRAAPVPPTIPGSTPPPAASPGLPKSPAAMLDSHGHLARGLRVTGKTELVNVLRRWLAESGAPTIGDVGAFGGRPCLLIDVGGHTIALNVDTKRAAVETFVRESSPEPERPWRVVINRRGRINKVLPGTGPDVLPGWYAYLTRAWDAEGVI